MGKHSKREKIAARQMLPVFRVISDLEDPKYTNQSLVLADNYAAQESRESSERDSPGRDETENGEEKKVGKSKLRRMDGFDHSQPERGKKERSPKGRKCKRNAKLRKEHTKFSPEKLNFAANFTHADKVFDVSVPHKRIGLFASMQKDIYAMRGAEGEIMDKSLDNFESLKVNPSDNPVYEDPRDVIDKGRFKSRSGSDSSKMTKEEKATLKEQKKKLAKKYESLIVSLMDRCEDNMALLGEKQAQLLKMKQKLKLLHAYNEQFANENERLRRQQAEASACLAQCRDVAQQLEARNGELESRVRELEGPDQGEPEAEVKLVEVCMSCNTREIAARHVQQQNAALQSDMTAMKDVIYRLNIQLSRYQEKMRTIQSSNENKIEIDSKEESQLKAPSEITKSSEERVNYSNIFESLNNANLEGITATQVDSPEDREVVLPNETKTPVHQMQSPAVLNANALGPLFEAYQESIQEKDTLILDYEKQFANFNQRMKQVLQANKTLIDNLSASSEELSGVRESLKRCAAEKESSELDKAALAERTEKAERKLKEVYELYEDKVAAITRDYETVHGEYYACRRALGRAEQRAAQLAAGGARTVPADLHERSLHDCKRLFEELKYQYGIERDKREEQLTRVQGRNSELEGTLQELRAECDKLKVELKTALKNVRLYRRAAVVFRTRLRASAASVSSMRRSRRRARPPALAPELSAALDKVERIKAEIQTVKASAYRSLAEVERRMSVQRHAAAAAAAEHARDAHRMRLVLEHKESIIRNLIDKVADVEEARMIDYTSHRLHGVPSPALPSRREDLRRQEAVCREHGGQDPVARGQDPTTRGHGPSNMGQDPMTRRHDTSTRGHDPMTRGHGPSATGHDPMPRGHGPSTKGHDPMPSGHGPSTRGHDPMQDPATKRPGPSTREHDPTTRGQEAGAAGQDRRQGSVKLVPAPGGYFQEMKDDRRPAGS